LPKMAHNPPIRAIFPRCRPDWGRIILLAIAAVPQIASSTPFQGLAACFRMHITSRTVGGTLHLCMFRINNQLTLLTAKPHSTQPPRHRRPRVSINGRRQSVFSATPQRYGNRQSPAK
jgi:hypothetical protein